MAGGGGIALHKRAELALTAIAATGGRAALPEVLTNAEARALMGEQWFASALLTQTIAGIQVDHPGGVWRCDRDAFVTWLEELLYDHPPAIAAAAVDDP